MENIKEARKRLGWSQQQLADRVGISQQAVFTYEKGEARPPADVLCNIADALGVDVNYLLGRIDQPVRDNRLPLVWEQAVRRAVELGISPGEVLEYIEFLGQRRSRATVTGPDRLA